MIKRTPILLILFAWLQKENFYEYGTTLSGLMQKKNINPNEFLEFVHDIDISWLPKDELLIRQKYNWFVYLTKEEIYNIDTAITRYIKESEVNSLNLHKNKYISSITSI